MCTSTLDGLFYKSLVLDHFWSTSAQKRSGTVVGAKIVLFNDVDGLIESGLRRWQTVLGSCVVPDCTATGLQRPTQLHTQCPTAIPLQVCVFLCCLCFELTAVSVALC